jgi:hypothetical protein
MKTVIRLVLIALLWIIAVSPGKIYGDTIARLQMAHSLWTGDEEIVLPPNYQPKSRLENVGVLGSNGKRYIAYEVGQALLMIPGDWLGTQLHKAFPHSDESFLRRVIVSAIVFIPLNVAAVVACFWLLRLFEFSSQIASLASITWLLGTTVLSYVQQPQQNNQVLLFVTIAYAGVLACLRYQKPYWAILSGLAAGTAVLMRMTSVIHVFTVFLFFLGCLLYKYRGQKNWVEAVKFLGLWLIGLIPGNLLGRFVDYLRFGSFFTNAQGSAIKQLNSDPIFAGLPLLPDNFPFNNPPYVGIWGVLFSPAKSIFIYDPLLLPCLVLTVIFWKRLSPYIQWYLVTCLLNLALHIVLTSRLDFWHGEPGWGARYHVTSIHLLLIPLIPLFLQKLLSAKNITKWLMGTILSLAIMAQMLSVILRPSAEVGKIYFATPRSFLDFRLGERITNVACLLNHSIFDRCPNLLEPANAEPLTSKITLMPYTFNKGRKFLFVVWGIIVLSAIAATYRFFFWGL